MHSINSCKKNIVSFNEEPSARYISAFNNDASLIETGYLDGIFDIVVNIVLLVGSFIMMLVYNAYLTGVACILFVPPILASLLTGKKVSTLEEKLSQNNETFVASLKDCLSGYPVIKSFQAESEIEDQFAVVNTKVEEAKRDKMKLMTIISLLSNVTGIIAQLGVFLVGGYMAIKYHTVSLGVIVIFVNLTGCIISPIQQLPTLFASRKAGYALIEKLAEEMKDNIREEGNIEITEVRKGIHLDNVCFGYTEDTTTLHNINLTFEKNKSYAIVGASGSGKSTLLNLLMASHRNYLGNIYFDGNELKDIQSSSLYDAVSLIQQNVFIFDATIEENITMYKTFNKENIEKAIRDSGLQEIIDKHGKDYKCGENGCGLSGGERQRISIARSLLRNASVLLVDEATAALDTSTSQYVSQSILNLRNMMRIVVTHNLEENLLKQYDQIVVMKDGSVIEVGKFHDLIDKKGYFYSLFTISK